MVTRDGSHTIALREKGAMYHSIHGAIRESVHVFIESGLAPVAASLEKPALSIFEMGFGTGLNAFLTAIFALEKKVAVSYTTVESTPLSPEEISALNYATALGHTELFRQLHACPWNEAVKVHEGFTLQKIHTTLSDFSPSQTFDLLYYDAFAPSAQPELWTKEVFEKMLFLLSPGGVLVTYCAKGVVKRAMRAAGFRVKKLPGPPGKREMVWAEKA